MSDYQHWFYLDSKKTQQGPINSEELSELVQSGEIKRKTYVWTNSLDEWIPASKVGQLFDTAPAAPPSETNTTATAYNSSVRTGIVALGVGAPSSPDTPDPPLVPTAILNTPIADKSNNLTTTQALVEEPQPARLNTAGIPISEVPASPQPQPLQLNSAGVPISGAPSSPRPTAALLNTAGLPLSGTPPLNAPQPAQLNTSGVPLTSPLPQAPAQYGTAGIQLNTTPTPTLLNTAGAPIANPPANALPRLSTTGAPIANNPLRLNTAGVPLPNTPVNSQVRLNTSGFPTSTPPPVNSPTEAKPLAKAPMKLSNPNPKASRPNSNYHKTKMPDSVIPSTAIVDKKPTSLQELLEAPPTEPRPSKANDNPDAPLFDTAPIEYTSRPTLRREKIEPKFSKSDKK